ncbi:MAG: hypothetical protein GY859_09710 [Desulfobacterales bacterium]|nr:hypothetical protein [Desulfobacterales bacterium]
MDEDHLGVVSKEQAQALMDAWGDTKRENRIRIAALHHNPRENVPSEIEAWIKMLEEEKVRGALENGIFKRFAADAVGLMGREHLAMIARNRQVSLFLHGHQHAYIVR